LIALLAALVGVVIARGTIVIGSQAFTAFWQAHAPGRFSQLYREPPMPSFSLDYRAFVFALVLATIITIAFALAPALRATKPSVCGALRGEISGIRLSTLHGWLLASQVAVCALFLIFSGVLLRDVIRASSIDPGFQVRGVFEVECSKHQAIEMAEKLNALPWAEQVAIANRVPLDLRLRVAASRPDKGDETRILANIVSPAYFATFGIPVVHGRNFTREEALTQQPVVILSETTAKKLWPNEDPLGKTIRTRIPHPPFQDAEVIGIVKDVANEGVLYPDRDCLYFPTEIGVSDGGALVVRSKAAPGTTALMLERVLEKISTSDEEQEPWYAPMQFVWDWQMLPMRAASWISALLGALALLLTVAGIYGVVAYLVSQRTQEIGIRMALGATRARVVGYILAKSMKLVSAGIGVGVLLALVASRLLSTKIGATIGEIDLMAYFTGPAIITIAAALAVLGPIRRASKVDPAVTLRAE